MIRVLIADDHPLIRAGFRQLVSEVPDIRVVGETATGDDVLQRLRTTPVDVVVLDISMPGPPFLTMLQRIRREHPGVRVLVVTVQPEGLLAIRALEAGAAGYVTKSQSTEELVTAVRKVHAGGRYVTPSLAEQLAASLAGGLPHDGHGRLSSREREVLRLLAAGRSNKEIAGAFGVSPKTVSTYRARLLKKLRLKTNADLVRYALEQGFTV